jgi:group I intron endonuclease
MMQMRKNIQSGIYCIENITNNKKYIGQSVDVEGRWSKHQNSLSKGNHDNTYLQNSWNKHGKENFKFYILEVCDVNHVDDVEKLYIELFEF